LPPQTQATIGDTLDAKHVIGFGIRFRDAALSDGRRSPLKPRAVIYAPRLRAAILTSSRITSRSTITNASIRWRTRPASRPFEDYSALLADAAAGRLPAVAFYKPPGNLNSACRHASVAEGDAHIAAWSQRSARARSGQHMVIVITYDEFAVHGPRSAAAGRSAGPDAHSPALIVSPFAKRAPWITPSTTRFHPAADHAPIRPRRTTGDHIAR